MPKSIWTQNRNHGNTSSNGKGEDKTNTANKMSYTNKRLTLHKCNCEKEIILVLVTKVLCFRFTYFADKLVHTAVWKSNIDISNHPKVWTIQNSNSHLSVLISFCACNSNIRWKIIEIRQPWNLFKLTLNLSFNICQLEFTSWFQPWWRTKLSVKSFENHKNLTHS